MPKISNSIKSGDFGEFDNGVKDASVAVCALTESAAQVSCHGTDTKTLLFYELHPIFAFLSLTPKYFHFWANFFPPFQCTSP